MPPKKKKSGKKKLAKMTEEERLLYMEQKRLAEEEMKKKKEDMLTQFLKVLEINCTELILTFHSLPYICRLILGQALKRRKKFKIQSEQASKPVEGHNERRYKPI